MRYKRYNFVGMHLWEEKKVIEYIIKGYSKSHLLTDQQLFLLDKSMRIIADNQEFTVTTLNKLLDLFYYTLHLEPIDFQKDKNGRYKTSGWYDIPINDRDAAARKLNKRLKKRHRFVDEVWYSEFNESFGWKQLIDRDDAKNTAKELIKKALGSREDKICESRNPGSAVIVPFKKET